ncbi:hypothetical protein MMC29_000501 [Sticta canariensis]|nr:hypothetical protein [Sticta canariensis]
MAARALALALAGAVLLAGAHAQQQSTGLQDSLQGFIRVSGLNFVDDNCNDFYFSGYNTWEVRLRAVGRTAFDPGSASNFGDWQRSAAASVQLMKSLWCLQAIEAAAGICCGGQAGLDEQLNLAGMA